MLLRKYHENRAQLRRIGLDALEERRQLGLPITADELAKEQKLLAKLAEEDEKMSRAFVFDGRSQPLITDYETATARAESLRRLYPEHRYEVVPGGGAWRIAQQDDKGDFENWVQS